SGVAVSIVPADKLLVPGLSTELVITISNNGSRPIRPYLLDLNGSAVGLDANSRLPLFPGRSLPAKGRFATPNNANINVPHYQHLYDGRLFGEELEATAYMQIEGTSITVPAEMAMDVGPAMEIANISPSPIVRTPAATKTKLTSAAQCIYRDSDFNLRLTNNQDSPFSGELVTGSSTGRRTGSRKLTIGPHESVKVLA